MAVQSTFVDPSSQGVEEIILWKAVGWSERVAALLLLLAFGPVLIAAGIIIMLLARQTPLVAHQRIGQYGHPFWVLKLRTMWSEAGHRRPGFFERIIKDPAALKTAADPRVTSRFARLCRRFSVDELPQLINVMRGEMSFVGPRPLTREEMRIYYARYAPEVLSVRPGITGLWQVRGRNRLSYRARRKFDLILVRNRSIGLYVGILLRTVPVVLSGRNSW